MERACEEGADREAQLRAQLEAAKAAAAEAAVQLSEELQQARAAAAAEAARLSAALDDAQWQRKDLGQQLAERQEALSRAEAERQSLQQQLQQQVGFCAGGRECYLSRACGSWGPVCFIAAQPATGRHTQLLLREESGSPRLHQHSNERYFALPPARCSNPLQAEELAREREGLRHSQGSLHQQARLHAVVTSPYLAVLCLMQPEQSVQSTGSE